MSYSTEANILKTAINAVNDSLTDYTLTELKTLLLEVREDFDAFDDYRIALHGGECRVIAARSIDEIQCDELSGDPYILGAFNPEFLSSILDAPEEAIRSMQESGAYEGIGEWILGSGDSLQLLQEGYRDIDGYGHHFAYDGEEREVNGWYIFRTN